MASFKRLKRSDVISVPYVANKKWFFEYCPYPENDQYIKIYKGTNLTGSFSLDEDPITEGQYERLVYSQINHLFYQQYSPNVELLDTGSLLRSLYYDNSSQIRATGSYFDYNENPGIIKNLPTGSNEGIRVLSIDQDLYGQQILPYHFELTSSVYSVKDDGNGNLIDTKNSNTHIGNIFYSHGLCIITNQDYQLMFPLTPLAKYKSVTYLDTDTNRVINLIPSTDGRGGDIDITSISLSGENADFYDINSNGTVKFDDLGLGSYPVTYTINSILPGSSCSDKVLTSNNATLVANVVNNCAFKISVVEKPL